MTGDVSLPGYPSLITHEQGISGASLVLTGDLYVGQGAAVDVSEKGLLGGISIDAVTGIEIETLYAITVPAGVTVARVAARVPILMAPTLRR